MSYKSRERSNAVDYSDYSDVTFSHCSYRHSWFKQLITKIFHKNDPDILLFTSL